MASERSGSNLITQIMNNHSLMCGPTPSHAFRTFLLNMSNYGELAHNWHYLTEDFVRFINNKLGVWNTKVTQEEVFSLFPKSIFTLLRYVYQKEAESLGKSYAFVKENRFTKFSNHIVRNFEDPKIVYLYRDPRDMVLSYLKSPNHVNDLEVCSKIWQDEQSEYIAFQKKYPNNVFPLSYESLISNPERVLKDLCAFLNIEFEKNLLVFNQNKMTQANAERIKDWENLQHQIITDNCNKYRVELSVSQIQKIEAICGEEMKVLGYQPETDFSKCKENGAFENKIHLTDEEMVIRENRLKSLEKVLNRSL